MTVKADRGAGRGRRSTTSSPRASASTTSSAEGRDPRAAWRSELRHGLARQAQARRCSTRSTSGTPSSCPGPGRAGVRQHLAPGRARSRSSRAARFADEDTTEETAQAEYRRIAERRVRLGLVLAEVGERRRGQGRGRRGRPRRWSSWCGSSRARRSRSGTTTARTRRRWPRSARRCSRRRSSTTSSAQAKVTERDGLARGTVQPTRTTRTTRPPPTAGAARGAEPEAADRATGLIEPALAERRRARGPRIAPHRAAIAHVAWRPDQRRHRGRPQLQGQDEQ